MKKTVEDCVEVLPIPQLSVIHNGAQITCNHHILKFWDKCRIAPVSGSKNVNWISMFPSSPNTPFARRVPLYMSQIAAMWDILSFGQFAPCSSIESFLPGLIPVEISDNHHNLYQHIMCSYYSSLPKIGKISVITFSALSNS